MDNPASCPLKNDYEKVLGEKRAFLRHRGRPRSSVREGVFLGEERGLPHRATHTPAGTYSERGAEIEKEIPINTNKIRMIYQFTRMDAYLSVDVRPIAATGKKKSPP